MIESDFFKSYLVINLKTKYTKHSN